MCVIETLNAMLEPGENREKPWVYKKVYTGKRGGYSNESGFGSCALALKAGKRFLVTMECTGSSDLALLDALIGSMNLEALAKAR